MVRRHTELETFTLLTGDFECAWDALATRSEAVAPNRGNFMFALQSTILLEWLCRLCGSDSEVLNDFATELQRSEPRYFTELSAPWRKPNGLSFPGVHPERSLLLAVWDLIRNGQAHQYQDIIAELTDGRHWALWIKGVQHEWPLSRVAAERSLLEHLSYRKDPDGDLILLVHPGVLFLDIRDAARNSKLLERGLTTTPFPRTCEFDMRQLEESLARGGLPGARLAGSRVAARPRLKRCRAIS
jgi:hypothetical protein